jgi:hypothetical protein
MPMTAEQFDETIEKLCEVRPFHPFTIEFNNGSRFEVDHTRYIANSNGEAFMYLPGRKPMWFGCDSVTRIVRDLASEVVP